ncbi:glycosyltransferase, partial [Acinetobacter baumannii]|uniref:glycosyltransferase n=1 Tax=Acinetobacter baumannii TaxID=470 RepID=UPI001C47C791
YERRAENGGFLECCNSTVQLARGEVIVLLNSDTRVVDGWLDELVEAFELFPKAGMVGSKLFNDDGPLPEAGGIFWRDGSAHNYGRGDDPNRPQYCFARQADFISGASIAIRKSVWDALGGFDPVYKPAYCEDADLAFRLRRAGYETWFVPTSRVIHY